MREERKIEEAPAAYTPIGPVIDSQVRAGGDVSGTSLEYS